MKIYERTSSSEPLSIVTRLRLVLHCFSLITLITIYGARIYGSYFNDEIPTVPFVTFVCFTAFLKYYCFELIQEIPPWEKSPKKHKLQIGIWLLMSALMIGFCCKFSKLTGSSASLSFLGVALGGNMLVLHLYSVWRDYNLSLSSVIKSRDQKCFRANERTSEMETNNQH